MGTTLNLASKTGQRAESPAAYNAKQLIQNYDQMSFDDRPERSDAFEALPMMKTICGISSSARELLGILISVTQEQDWNHGDPLIVWPANEYLSMKLNCTVRTVQKRLRELLDAGLITFRDGPQGYRRGYRNTETERIVIEHTFGIDLRPMAAQVHEFISKADAIKADYKETRAIRKRASVLLKSVVNKLATLASPKFEDTATVEDHWPAVESAQEIMEVKYPTKDACQTVLNSLAPIEAELERVLAKLFRQKARAQSKENKSNTPQGESFNTHKTTTIPQPSKEGLVLPSKKGSGAEDEKPSDITGPVDATDWEPSNRLKPEAVRAYLDEYKVTPNKIKRACPNLVQGVELFAGNRAMPDDWDGVEKSAMWALQQLGIADHAWHNACAVMGKRAAAICVLLIYEQSARSMNGEDAEVGAPGGLLYWHAREANRTGELKFVGKIYKYLPKIRCAKDEKMPE